MQTQSAFDNARMNAFGEKVLNDAAAMMFGNLAYIGDQLGLFEVMAKSGPMTSDQLAEAASCHPRYIREWLSGMSAAGWVEYDPNTAHFTLPAEHAPFLVDRDHPAYMGGFLEQVNALAHVAPRILECFRQGGGISLADHHPDLPRIIERGTAPWLQNFLTKVWIPELLPDVHQKLLQGARVADVGCGSGKALVLMAEAYPNSRFVGYEPHDKSAERARAAVERAHLEDRVQIITAPSDEMPDRVYDFITTFDVIHDLAVPQKVIDDIRRALKDDGTYLMQEINASHRLEDMLNTMGKLFYSVSTMACMTFSLAQNGAGIGTCMGAELPKQMCAKAGFSNFRRLPFQHPLLVVYEIRV